jgi:dTDP-4-dehydrorhamnose 3,5-epimerase
LTVRVQSTGLEGCVLIETERVADERGFFARTYDAAELAQWGLPGGFAQISVSFNPRRGTLRGLHYQAAPGLEQKLVRCERGRIFDVAVDLRPGSHTFARWWGGELSEDNLRQLYLPPGFAHGFQTLSESSRICYHISPRFQPELSAGVRWDDPDIAVEWPMAPEALSARDLSLPSLRELDLASISQA